jgi:hypothetical protein
MLVRRKLSSCAAASCRNEASSASSAATRDSTKFWNCEIASVISEMSFDAVNFDIHSDFDRRMPSTPSRSV